MKKEYINPTVEIYAVDANSIIATSPSDITLGTPGDKVDAPFIDFDEDVDIEW